LINLKIAGATFGIGGQLPALPPLATRLPGTSHGVSLASDIS